MANIQIAKNNIIKKIETEIEEMCVDAFAIEVVDGVTCNSATNQIIRLKKLTKELEAQRKAVVKPKKDEIKAFEGEVNKTIEKANVALKTISDKYATYTTEQERIERERIEKERERQIAELKEQARLAEQHIIETAEKHNVPELYEQALEQESIANAKIVELMNLPDPEVKVTNRGDMGTVFFRDNWTGTVVDKLATLKWIILATEAGIDMTHLVDFNQSRLNEFAKTKKIDTTFNGIKIYNNRTVSGR